ncbi:MAG: hypothetical protein HY026_04610 [Deltaproteobacteria bacterium]|nr:hypothetical protein [Deltaproteobacteria bacterium]
MTELDVMESLKRKEEELENLLIEAREKASQIKKDALRRAEEIKLSMSKETGRLLEEYKRNDMKKINEEVEAIKAEAQKKSEELRFMAGQRLETAVAMVVRYVLEGK